MLYNIKKTIAVLTVFILFCFVAADSYSLGTKSNSQSDSAEDKPGLNVRFEHIEINVPDALAFMKWYTANLGFKVIREGKSPNYVFFLSDEDKNMMFEVGQFAHHPALDFNKINTNSMHIAYAVNDITAIKEKLIATGAVLVEDIFKTPSGDQVLMLRDPWGIPIQFVERVNPMLKPGNIRFEHLEINVSDPQAVAKWYIENLGLKIMRGITPPTYTGFIGDQSENMMLELNHFDDFEIIDFENVHHMSIHTAFVVEEDIELAKQRLVEAGATVVLDVNKTDVGDFILMLRDPWGFPIQMVKRAKPML